jgi:ArsR family transcriptional regulator, nickel/cobalt-responsive transcriptional repressor
VSDRHAAGGAVSPNTAEAVADAMFALSTASRVRILSSLRERAHTVRELMAAVGMEQSAVSHQLRVLREYGLVVAERRGRERLYALHDEHVASLLDEAVGHVAHLGRSGKRAAKKGLRDAS